MMAQGCRLTSCRAQHSVRGKARGLVFFLGIALWLGPIVQAGELHATVVLDGPAPKPEVLRLESPKEAKALKECGHGVRHSQQLLVAPSGGVQYAVAWLERPTGPPAEAREVTVTLDQRECTFVPHVLIVPLGGRLAIRNSDPVVHNLRIFRDAARFLEQWQQPRAKEVLWEAKEPGRYLMRCGVHPWMYAWVVVAAHRFFGVTNPTGEVIMPDVPPGTYTLRVWHETLGETQRQVTIGQQPTMVTIRLTSEHNNERGSS